MAGQNNNNHDTITAYDKAGEQFSKLQLLQAMLSEGGNPLSYEGAAMGMYYILEDAIETLQESMSVLYEAATEDKPREPETAEDTTRAQMLDNLSRLNDEGRGRALVYMRDLAGIERYTAQEGNE